MLKGDLKDHNIRLYLGMPMYGGMLGENTLHGVLGLQAWTSAQGVGMKLQTMGNESLITRARSISTAQISGELACIDIT